ncbi:hypothetical protein KSP40_PGU009178 [Platanthera guangdongensis]|uniref:Uncharacterized protein n=1 Tax=Platanthera guangdongensis TaxID=2320717 RepID=A0ABR2LLI2_9ASPA
MRNHKLGFIEDASINPSPLTNSTTCSISTTILPTPSRFSYVGDVETLERNQSFSIYNIGKPATSEWLLKNKKSPWIGKKMSSKGILQREKRSMLRSTQRRSPRREERGRGRRLIMWTKLPFMARRRERLPGTFWVAPPRTPSPPMITTTSQRGGFTLRVATRKGCAAIQFFPKHGHLLLSAAWTQRSRSGMCSI